MKGQDTADHPEQREPTVANVADLRRGAIDVLGNEVTCVYGRKPPQYGVYGSEKRVLIHYADAGAVGVADRQRRYLAHLAPVRGEIDGLIDGWRQGTTGSFLDLQRSHTLQEKAQRYCRRVADALIVALEEVDDPGSETAGGILATIRQDIVDERTAHARFEYLVAALLTALALMFGSVLVISAFQLGFHDPWPGQVYAVGLVLLPLLLVAAGTVTFVRVKRCGPPSQASGLMPNPWPAVMFFCVVAIGVLAATLLLSPTFVALMSTREHRDHVDLIVLWRAAAAGSIGAFFSIAIGIRTRTILTDLLRMSNLMDAALRVAIGFIAAGVLMALLVLQVVTVSVGNGALSGGTLLSALIVGFIAGFSERLVPDLLAKASAQTTGPSTPRPASPSSAAAAAAATAATTPGQSAAKASANGPAVPDPSAGEAAVDGCASGHALAAADLTDDVDLPAAAGGVKGAA